MHHADRELIRGKAAELDRGAVMCNLVKAEQLPGRSMGPVINSVDFQSTSGFFKIQLRVRFLSQFL